jgi:hypothetical protein
MRKGTTENRKRAVNKATKLCAERSEACALTRSLCTGK